MNAVARVISYVFHPLFLTTYLFAMFALVLPSAWSPVPIDRFQHLLLLLFLVTFVLPAINVYLFRVLGNISSLRMETRKERILPFIFIAAVYCAVTYMIHSTTGIDWTDNFLKFMIIIDALVVVAAVVTLFYKISVHSLSICGLIGIMIPLNRLSEEIPVLYVTMIIIVLAGVIMSSRLQLKAHTQREVLAGAILGVVTGFVGMTILF